jgi:hypothetical protein
MTDLPKQPDQFLTPEESAEVDKAMLTARDRFSTRVTIYSLRSLKQIAQEKGRTIANLAPEEITEWVARDPSLQPDDGFDEGFKRFFSQLVISSLKPLRRMAQENQLAIEALTLEQVIAWFEKEAKLRIEEGNDATFLN